AAGRLTNAAFQVEVTHLAHGAQALAQKGVEALKHGNSFFEQLGPGLEGHERRLAAGVHVEVPGAQGGQRQGGAAALVKLIDERHHRGLNGRVEVKR
nr:hypothetical protein [Tanacetum cinerariifolium]